jgi:hypothetical protein
VHLRFLRIGVIFARVTHIADCAELVSNEEHRLWSKAALVQILALPLTSCVTLEKLLHLSVLPFPIL